MPRWTCGGIEDFLDGQDRTHAHFGPLLQHVKNFRAKGCVGQQFTRFIENNKRLSPVKTFAYPMKDISQDMRQDFGQIKQAAHFKGGKILQRNIVMGRVKESIWATLKKGRESPF